MPTLRKTLAYKTFCFCFYSVVHVVDEALTPPGMVESLAYVKDFTDIVVDIVMEFFTASGWDASNIALSIEPAEEISRFTLFAPTDSVFESYDFMDDVRERFATPEWVRHLELLLKNMLVADPLTKEELAEFPFQSLTTEGGEQIIITNSTGALLVGDGEILDLSPSCVDG